MLTVTTAAADRTLLTLDELRAALGVPTGKDLELAALNARTAAAIAKACKVARGGIVAPTLRLETLSEKIYMPTACESMLILSRPPVKITSIEVDDVALTADIFDGSGNITTPSPDYEIDGYLVRRLSSGYPTNWAARKVEAVYTSGWAVVPDDLKLAACLQARAIWTVQNREPGLRSMEIPGVISESYQDRAPDASAVTDEVMELLMMGGYVNMGVL